MYTIIFGIEEIHKRYNDIHTTLKRKLYKTSLTKEEIVHPIELPAPDGAGKDQDYARPLQWRIGDSVFVTLWDDWLSEFNKKNDKFVLASY